MIKFRLFFILTLIIFSASFISSFCQEGQIDINTASLEELDNLYGIGPVKAQAIIDARDFSSVDDLITVKGIGEITLENIKSQGLACVNDAANKEDNYKEEIVEEPKDVANSAVKTVSQPTNLETIELNPKVIKTEENFQDSDKRDNAFYGLLAFGILLGLLFLGKFVVERKKRNELQ